MVIKMAKDILDDPFNEDYILKPTKRIIITFTIVVVFLAVCLILLFILEIGGFGKLG